MSYLFYYDDTATQSEELDGFDIADLREGVIRIFRKRNGEFQEAHVLDPDSDNITWMKVRLA